MPRTRPVRSAGRVLASLPGLSVLVLLLGGLGLLALLAVSSGHAVGLLTETLRLDDGRWLARLEVPGLRPETVLLPSVAGELSLVPGKSWLLARGTLVDLADVWVLDAHAVAVRHLDTEIVQALVAALDRAGWALVALGLGLLLFGTFALRLAATALGALLAAAIAWHAMQLAAFEGLLSVAARLEPAWLVAALALGGALAARAVFATPSRLLLRLGGAATMLALSPVIIGVHPWGTAVAMLLPVMAFAAPILAAGIAAALALHHGLDLAHETAPWLALGCIGMAALVQTLQPDLDPLPVVPPETQEALIRARRNHTRARRLGDWIRGGLS